MYGNLRRNLHFLYTLSMENSNPSDQKSQFSEEKMDRIIELLEKIERHYNPPKWKIMLTFFFQHFLTIVVLIFLAYAVWKIWSIVDGIQGNMTNMKDLIVSQFQKLRLW